jgi:hypothetical protein
MYLSFWVTHSVAVTVYKQRATNSALGSIAHHHLQCHFEHSRDYTDINMAITIQEKADHLTFNGHSDKPACLINFEASFTCRCDAVN